MNPANVALWAKSLTPLAWTHMLNSTGLKSGHRVTQLHSLLSFHEVIRKKNNCTENMTVFNVEIYRVSNPPEETVYRNDFSCLRWIWHMSENELTVTRASFRWSVFWKTLYLSSCPSCYSACAQLKTPIFSVLIVHVYYWILPRSRTCEKGLVLRFTNMCFVFLCKNTPTWSLNWSRISSLDLVLLNFYKLAYGVNHILPK